MASLALLLSLVFLALSVLLLQRSSKGPYFINTPVVLSADKQMERINKSIEMQYEILRNKESEFNDSLKKLFDSLEIQSDAENDLIELLTLESNVYRHKMIDSISKVSHEKISRRVNSINNKLRMFGEERKMRVLFGSGDNFVVFGVGTKADITENFIHHVEEEK